MHVYVLLDSDAKVNGVVTDLAVADEWLTFDDSFSVTEGQLNDYMCFDLALEAVTESESCCHLNVPRTQEPT